MIINFFAHYLEYIEEFGKPTKKMLSFIGFKNILQTLNTKYKQVFGC